MDRIRGRQKDCIVLNSTGILVMYTELTMFVVVDLGFSRQTLFCWEALRSKTMGSSFVHIQSIMKRTSETFLTSIDQNDSKV